MSILRFLGIFLGILLIIVPPSAADDEISMIRVVCVPNDPPFVYNDENGKLTGFNVELFNIVAANSNLTVTYRLTTWAEARRAIEQGTSDLVLGMMYSPKRDTLVDFTRPILSANGGIYTLGGNDILSLEDIRGKRTAVMAGDIMHDYLLENDTGTTIMTAETQEGAWQFLLEGKSDCALGVISLGSLHFTDDSLPKGLVAHDLTDVAFDYCFAVREGNTKVLDAVNRGLDTAISSGQYRVLYRKYFTTPENSVSLKYLLRLLMIGVGPIFMIVVLLLTWNWSLKMKVDQQTESLRDELAERLKAQEALRNSEEKYRGLFETTQDAIVLTEQDGSIINANSAWLELYGYTREEALNGNIKMVYLTDVDRQPIIEAFESTGSIYNYEITHQKKDGTRFTCLLTANVRMDESGNKRYFQTSVRDISRQRQLEQEFIQSQKMETVGRLAGGIAHDFNNLLTVIIGNTDLALHTAEKDSALHEELTEILKTSHRAADLVSQLLAFSRSQDANPSQISMNETLSSMYSILKRLLGEKVHLVLEPGKDLWPVCMDKTQLEQVITNLAVNARDAMPDGGVLTMRTYNANTDKDEAESGSQGSDAVHLQIRDNGSGIPLNIQNKIFEPFFTTKDLGKGTGLGLSTCYGIIERAGGIITVSSIPGYGSTFVISLPRDENKPPTFTPPVSDIKSPVKALKILLVEDEPLVRKMVSRVLTRVNYEVVTAESGEDALEKADDISDFDLLISDFVMPGINGSALAGILQQRHPGLKVLFMSGYTFEEIDNEHNHLILKPFQPTDLLARVNEIMNSDSTA